MATVLALLLAVALGAGLPLIPNPAGAQPPGRSEAPAEETPGDEAFDEEPERTLKVRQTSDGLSVEARRVPFGELLQAISRATGIRVYLEAGLDAEALAAPQDVTFKDLPIEEALKRVLRSRNFVVGYRSDRVDEVRIFHGAGVGPFTPLPAGRAQARRRAPVRPVTSSSSSEPTAADIARLEETALSHADPEERSRALSELSDVADEAKTRETALAVLERDPHPEVLEEALNILESQEDVPADRVLRFASSDRPSKLRVQALEMLKDQEAATPDQIRQAAQALARDPDEEVRERALQILEDLEEEQEPSAQTRR